MSRRASNSKPNCASRCPKGRRRLTLCSINCSASSGRTSATSNIPAFSRLSRVPAILSASWPTRSPPDSIRSPETAGGLFVSGGSVANMTALAAARRAMLDERGDDAVIYFSDQTHNSVEKALRVLGFAREQIRALPSDEDFRLPVESLRRAVAEDRAEGKRPFCVIANAGTTNTGAVDPLDQLADLCEWENLWLHVDGAYGAAACLSERGRKLLAGIERAD